MLVIGHTLTFFSLLLLLKLFLISGETITPESFDAEVLADDSVWIVEFQSGMCGSCKEFAPEWKRVATSLKNYYKTGKIDIDEPAGMQLAQRLGVLEEGIPLIKVFNTAGDNKGASILIEDGMKFIDVLPKLKPLLAGGGRGTKSGEGFVQKLRRHDEMK